MTISYPLALPSSPGFVRFRWRAINVTSESVSPFSLVSQVQQHPGDAWAFEAQLPKMRRAQAEDWITTRLKCKGKVGTFLVGDPFKTPRGSWVGTPLISGAVAERATSITIKGFTNSATGVVKAGDTFQVGSGDTTRLYKSLNDADADGSGNATLDIWPDVRNALSDDDAITFNAAKGTFMFATSEADWDLDRLLNVGMSFSAKEALR